MKDTTKWHYAWIILLGICIIRGLAGGAITSSSGLFFKPVADDLGVGIGQLSLYLSISSLAMLVWLPFAGKLVQKKDCRYVATIGVLLQSGSFIALGFMDHLWAWYIFAIPGAIGNTLLINLLGPVLINRWFKEKAGLAIGIMMAAVGLFGAFFQPFTSWLIASSGWRGAYWTLGGLVLIGVLIVTWTILKNDPQQAGLAPYDIKGKNVKQASVVWAGITATEARRSWSFYLLLIFMVAITGFGVFGQHITTYGLSLGFSLTKVGGIMSVWMIGTVVGALFLGIFTDLIGVFATSLVTILLGGLSIGLYVLSNDHFLFFGIATFLHGITAASVSVLGPILTREFFGQKDYETLYANIMLGAPLASIVLIPLYGFIYDFLGGYDWVFAFLALMILVALLSLVIGYRKRLRTE